MGELPVATMSMVPRCFTGLTAALCCIALVLQFDLVTVEAARLGAGTAMAVMAYCSFFTIQTTVLAALILSLTAAAIGPRLFSPRLKTAVAVYIAVGGLIFFAVLRPAWHHTGLQALADVLLHYVVPTLYAVYWLVAVPKRDLRWRDPVLWMIYPVCYFVAMLVFGLWSGFFPYPFFDLPAVGLSAVAINAAALFVAFLSAGFVVVAVGHRLGRVGVISTSR